MTLLPEIESALMRAVERDVAGRMAQPRLVRAARDWLRARHRGVALVLAALVTAGAATAAVTLSGRASRPLRGTIAVSGPNGALGSLRYSIGGLVPSLAPGRVGWCVTYGETGRLSAGAGKAIPAGRGVGGCSYAAAIGRPVFASDGSHGPGLHFFLTAPDVAAVRVNGRLTVLTRPDPQLPYGLRAAVFQARLDAPVTDVVALDHHDRAIPAALPVLPAAPTIAWRAPHPQPDGACSITLRTESAPRVLGGIAVRGLVPTAGIQGRAFLPCVELELLDEQFYMEAALLLDAAHPGSSPAPLPGMRPVPGHSGWFDSPNPQAFPDGGDRGLNPGFDATDSNLALFDPNRFGSSDIPMPDGGVSARRVGNAWLVVQGGRGTAQRLTVLATLQPGRVELNAPIAIGRPTGARCWLNIHPLPSLTLVDEEKPDWRLQRSLGRECLVATSFYLNGWPIEALFGSRNPPSATFLPPEPLTASRRSILTRHRGSGWLQITGGSGPAQRRALATAVTIPGP